MDENWLSKLTELLKGTYRVAEGALVFLPGMMIFLLFLPTVMIDPGNRAEGIYPSYISFISHITHNFQNVRFSSVLLCIMPFVFLLFALVSFGIKENKFPYRQRNIVLAILGLIVSYVESYYTKIASNGFMPHVQSSLSSLWLSCVTLCFLMFVLDWRLSDRWRKK